MHRTAATCRALPRARVHSSARAATCERPAAGARAMAASDRGSGDRARAAQEGTDANRGNPQIRVDRPPGRKHLRPDRSGRALSASSCRGAPTRSILARDENVVAARLTVNYRGLRFDLTTRNPKQRPHWLAVRLEQGPFRRFEGEWRLVELAPEACKIEFALRYEFDSALVGKLADSVFDAHRGHDGRRLRAACRRRARPAAPGARQPRESNIGRDIMTDQALVEALRHSRLGAELSDEQARDARRQSRFRDLEPDEVLVARRNLRQPSLRHRPRRARRRPQRGDARARHAAHADRRRPRRRAELHRRDAALRFAGRDGPDARVRPGARTARVAALDASADRLSRDARDRAHRPRDPAADIDALDGAHELHLQAAREVLSRSAGSPGVPRVTLHRAAPGRR